MKSVYAPVSGKALALEDTVDPVFSEKMLGDGYAIEPDKQAKIIHSPVTGRIAVVNGQNHALAITSEDGLDVLVHVGVDTVDLNGEGFKMLCKAGENVEVGQPLMEVDFKYIKAYATDNTVFVIITNTTKEMVFAPTPYRTVTHQDLLYSVR
ncbi:PTS sugar transporter subunit IIA [Entomospira culicis]|uniref:PTS system glucose-specific EIIA component n=1 Tax=Entomospira culicis TaxID=2719989 RepID=A0A968GFA7_9SPIO|nr:PTS glucose transporter subunit IIA [Entomospira culicis]NIZ18560.1 PTS glucose transporter subunit IIA [Entomospira culicis]NIZ68776.1 PTS glucose transporter subunit IIA [Entomospira culicis]WDI37372.1 PTS glucose transporter subunit IIA [Entomospira culicis]WDI39001.1 PTS glucose transporter subunit IIA [Entomospira culicis]